MNVLIIADEQRARRLRLNGFAEDGAGVHTASSESELGRALSRHGFEIALLDTQMSAADSTEMLHLLHEIRPELPVIAICAAGHENATEALRAHGVREHLVRPFPVAELHAALARHALTASAVEPVPEIPEHVEPPEPAPAECELVFTDPTMKKTVELALRAATSRATILILGESGTGKTVLARMIHRRSALSAKPFVTVNCPCLSRELLESELFGHVKGAFTGAIQDTWGKVAAAEGGTLFLDEIGELPAELQAKLLRLLQEREYERVGETKPRQANVRVIAATNRDLKAAVSAGTFREDLYYRLNVISLVVPPLRQRPQDIISSTESFLAAVSHQLGKAVPTLDADARHALQNYTWPGNLRELRNMVERAVILCERDTLTEEDFPELARTPLPSCPQIGEHVSLRYIEEAHIREVMARSPSLDYAARILGIDKSTLYRKRLRMQPQVSTFPPLGLESETCTGALA